MSAAFVPQDNDVRKRIRESLDETLFVEAGAGTGKTTSLVDRVMTLATSGRTTLDRVAVITFTDAAAAELRDRISGSLEKAASDETLNDDERSRCQRALADLDRSSIQTLHSFAGSILRERPLEAGLPPIFETMDAIQSDLAFDEAWNGWIDGRLDEPEDESVLYPALTLGLSINDLRTVALEFHQNYDLLEGVSFPDIPVPQASAVRQLVDEAPELERLCQYSKLGESDPLYSHVQGLLLAANRFAELEDAHPSSYRQLRRTLPIKQGRGRQGDWERDPATSENACKVVKDLLGDLDNAATEELAQVHQAALMPALRALKNFVEDFAKKCKSDGKAGFHDLLVWARDLLRDNVEVRDYFRRRFSHLLVDEAQDTDPIQAEIAMFISEGVVEGGNDPLPGFPANAGNPLAEDSPAVNRPTSWDQVIPQRGKLFVVGDPKQSIYRFRRADVRQMSKLRQVMGGDTVQLVQNFRSQRPVLDWVNHVYESWMREGSSNQATYVHIAHRWEANVDHPGRPRVYCLGDEMDGNINAVRGEEARSIAGLLHTIVRQQWQVLDADRTAQAGGAEQYRDAGYSDICILIRTRTGLRTLETALEDANVPYRLEGSSLVFATQEVMDLLNCLKAIDDPADQVATVAALRSPAFACTDVELLQFSDAGGKFDYLSDDCPADGQVADALTELRRFHQDRLWMSLPELIDRFIRARMLMESAIDHPRTREQWRRYRFIVEQARSFVETGGNSLRAFLTWIERQAAEGARVTEAPVPEGDEEAVRIMTVHAAKGLEFPVVVLTALNSGRSSRRKAVLFDRDIRAVEISVGPEGRRFETPGYETLATWERELGDDEQVRLLYVASTRARDHLVLSLYRSSKGRTSDAHKIAEILDGADNLWEPLPLFAGTAPQLQDAFSSGFPPEGHSLASREEWNMRREEMLRQQRRPVSISATKLARVLKEEPDTDEPWRRGRAGTSVGRAVHSVLQTIDLFTGDGIEETSRAQAAAEGIPQRWAEVARLARVAVDSDIVRRAVAASRFWREVPVAAPMSNGVLQGFIDLLFEEDGKLVVVDYKTDAVDSDHVDGAAARYGPQGGAYALAVQKATGRPVTEVVFLFLHANRSAVLPNVSALAAKAASDAEEYLNNPSVR